MTDLSTPALAANFFPELVAVLIVVATGIAAAYTGRTIRKAFRHSTPQITFLLRRVASLLVWVAGSTIAIEELGMGTNAILLLVGLAGVAAIVALRGPLENLGAKFFADVYVPFKMGDHVRIGEHEGKVIEINAMTTILLSKDQHVVSIPNTHFLKAPVTNASPDAWREIVVPVTVNRRDLPRFESEVRKALGKLKLRLDERFPPILARKNDRAESNEFVLCVMVRNPEDREAITAEVNRRVAESLAAVQGTPPSGG
jgi:small conductance mechanosensitive channel